MWDSSGKRFDVNVQKLTMDSALQLTVTSLISDFALRHTEPGQARERWAIPSELLDVATCHKEASIRYCSTFSGLWGPLFSWTCLNSPLLVYAEQLSYCVNAAESGCKKVQCYHWCSCVSVMIEFINAAVLCMCNNHWFSFVWWVNVAETELALTSHWSVSYVTAAAVICLQILSLQWASPRVCYGW